MRLADAAIELDRIATEVRDIAARLDGTEPARWALARDLRATAFTLDRYIEFAMRASREAGEPVGDDTSWIATAAPGEIVEVFGR